MNQLRFLVGGARYVSALEEEVRSRLSALEAENHLLQMRVRAVEGELASLMDVSNAHLARFENIDRQISELGDLSGATREAVAGLLTEVAEVIAQELNEVRPL